MEAVHGIQYVIHSELRLTKYRALAMAQKFPHAQVYGLDLIPAPAANHDPPPNVHFEVGDINQGPRHFENSCDFLQMRCVGAGLPDYPEAINHVARCLKEGGLLIILDGDPWLCGEDIISAQRMYTENQRDGSWMHRYYYGTLMCRTILYPLLTRTIWLDYCCRIYECLRIKGHGCV